MTTEPVLLVLASTYPRWPGDVEPGFVHELSRRLVGRFRVIVLCPRAPGAPTRERMDGVEIVRFRYAPARMEILVNDGGVVANLRRSPLRWLLVLPFVLSQAWHTWRLMRRHAPDAVHAHWLLPQGIIAALLSLRSRSRLVVTSHGADLFALRGQVLTWFKRWVARRATVMTVVSSAMKQELVRIGVEPDRIRIEPMGVDLRHRFVPGTTPRATSELLFVGRLVRKKGLHVLLDAFPRVLQHHPGASLLIAGFGPEEGALRAQVASLGITAHVQFLGAVQQAQLPELYQRATALVAPFVIDESGDQEGLGLVPVEAAGCQCPLVICDVAAVREAFNDPTQLALVPSGDTAALADACVQVLSDPGGAQARARALRCNLLERFDWSVRAASYAELLTSGRDLSHTRESHDASDGLGLM